MFQTKAGDKHFRIDSQTDTFIDSQTDTKTYSQSHVKSNQTESQVDSQTNYWKYMNSHTDRESQIEIHQESQTNSDIYSQYLNTYSIRKIIRQIV